ncbi:D-lactate dehydrogenase [Beauveria brongniartii RCEF 3172]|uniref:D-lactate dehydrogenase n=1 Tax=Beauveria brongniartii RCEF 3172 TaxID=1081107 RepID=A0A162J316_9HYPO|nr:D-lactate dehydrogenase [Beauveria brongniartii RCEF 3172]
MIRLVFRTQPVNLSLEPYYTDRGPGRPSLGFDFVWNGARTEECIAWHEVVKNLGPLRPAVPNTDFALEKTTMHAFVAKKTSNLPLVAYGKTHSPSITRYSPQMAATFADMAATMPKTCVGGFATHTLRMESPSCSADHPDSVSPYRKPLKVVEILGFGVDEDAAPECIEWARVSHDRINKSDVLLPESYLALTASETMDLGAIYGSNLQELKKLKREYDPDNVFKHSLPKLL